MSDRVKSFKVVDLNAYVQSGLLGGAPRLFLQNYSGRWSLQDAKKLREVLDMVIAYAERFDASSGEWLVAKR